METPKLDWNSFVSRRRLKVSDWLDHHNIKSYEALVDKCNSLNMDPPKKNEVSFLFKAIKVFKIEKPVIIEHVVEEVIVEPVIEKAIIESPVILPEEFIEASKEEKKPRKKKNKKSLENLDKTEEKE